MTAQPLDQMNAEQLLERKEFLELRRDANAAEIKLIAKALRQRRQLEATEQQRKQIEKTVTEAGK